MRAALVSVLIALCVCTVGANSSKHKQYTYSGESVLSGVLRSRTFYGPPGYGDTPKQDAWEPQLILTLDAPIDIAAAEPPNDEYLGVTRVTLVPKQGVDFRPFVGKHISVKGELFGRVTAHHHTPVLLGSAELVSTK